MRFVWLAIAIAIVAIAIPAADAAQARAKHRRVQPQCVDRPVHFSPWGFLTNSAPEPNGCAPPVYDNNGLYVGQDPDPNIRYQLRRDPFTGYTSGYY
jgi:hypothetical protein